jgi:hypothetical protein
MSEKAPTRGPTRSPAFIAKVLFESERATDVAVAAQYGLHAKTIARWRRRAAEDPIIGGELEALAKRLEGEWLRAQARALASGWEAIEAAARRIAAMLSREGALTDDDLAVVQTCASVIDRAGGTLGGIDYAQRRAGPRPDGTDPSQ